MALTPPKAERSLARIIFDHLKGGLYGILRGLILSLSFLGLGIVNYLGSVFHFVIDLFNTVFGAPTAFFISAYRALITPFPDAFALIVNSLEMALIILPTILLQTLVNFVGSTLSMFFDFGWNTIVSAVAAVTMPFASLFDGVANGYDEDTSNRVKTSNILQELGHCLLSQNLPLNRHLDVNRFDKAANLIHGQNKFFAPVRPTAVTDSCSWTNQTYKLLI